VDPITLSLVAVTAGVSAVSFLRAAWTAIAKARLSRVKRAQSRSESQIARLEEQVRSAETLGARSGQPAAAKTRSASDTKSGRGWSRLEALGRKFPVALSLIVGTVFLLVTIQLTKSGTSQSRSPMAEISSPLEGASVPYREPVMGTSEGVPLDTQPWLFVQSSGGLLYPQGGGHGDSVNINRFDGSWCGYAYLGEPKGGDVGQEYTLILALPTSKENRRLQRHMESPKAGVVSRWRSLPTGFRQLGPARRVTRLSGIRAKRQPDVPRSCR
jgi:hypothetical protein